MDLVFYYKGKLEKITMKSPAIISFFFVTERTHLNVAHAQLLETDCFGRNLPICNDSVVRISRNLAKKKKVQNPRELLITQGIFNNTEHAVKTIYGELRKSSMSKFY